MMVEAAPIVVEHEVERAFIISKYAMEGASML